jgi:hypothetical protein
MRKSLIRIVVLMLLVSMSTGCIFAVGGRNVSDERLERRVFQLEKKVDALEQQMNGSTDT